MFSAHVVEGPSSKKQFKIEVICKEVNDDGVQWYWILLSQEDDFSALGVTIQGCFLCALWVENYKQIIQNGTKKAVEQRKGLSN